MHGRSPPPTVVEVRALPGDLDDLTASRSAAAGRTAPATTIAAISVRLIGALRVDDSGAGRGPRATAVCRWCWPSERVIVAAIAAHELGAARVRRGSSRHAALRWLPLDSTNHTSWSPSGHRPGAGQRVGVGERRRPRDRLGGSDHSRGGNRGATLPPSCTGARCCGGIGAMTGVAVVGRSLNVRPPCRLWQSGARSITAMAARSAASRARCCSSVAVWTTRRAVALGAGLVVTTSCGRGTSSQVVAGGAPPV